MKWNEVLARMGAMLGFDASGRCAAPAVVKEGSDDVVMVAKKTKAAPKRKVAPKPVETVDSVEVPTAFLRAALVCASRTEDVRSYLCGVHIDPKGFVVSTDGHRIFCGKIELPEVFVGDAGITIPRKVVERALIGNKSEVVVLRRDEIDGIQFKSISNSYPAWRGVIPETTSGEVAQFNPAYVGDMGKIGKFLFSGNKSRLRNGVCFHHNGSGPAGVTFEGCKDAFAVLMPMRVAAPDFGVLQAMVRA